MKEAKEKSINNITNIPDVSIGHHPIEKGLYLLDTIEINELRDVVLQWIDDKVPGAIIHGKPRIGKTYSINYLMKYFSSELSSEFCCFRFNCQKFQRPNENTFFEFLLRDVGHALFDKGKANAKRDRLFRYLLEKGDTSSRKQIVLFLDDSQRLQEIEYDWLMDIFNELDRYGITLTSFLVGQDELKHVRATYTDASMKQIVGRFMIQSYACKGIIDHYSLNYLLAGYDYAAMYPKKSDWSFTKYFFPNGFAQGYRIENFSEKLWETFVALHQNSGKQRSLEIPMYHMTTIVNYVFRKYGINGEGLEWINLSHWKEAIKNSGYQVYQGIS